MFGADIEDAKSWLTRRPTEAPEVTELQYKFISESESKEKHRSNVNHIQYSRLLELFKFSEVLLEAELETRKQHPVSHHHPNEAGERYHTRALEALLSQQTRWHPQAAKEVGEIGHYWIYKFPCCEAEIRRDDEAPSQFGPEGCTDIPEEVKLTLPRRDGTSVYGSRLLA